MEIPALPEHVGFVLSVLLSARHEAVLVGGCVRDLLLGRNPNDFDIATSAYPEETAALFPRVVLDGAAHGTVRVLTQGGPVEVTTYRSDGEYPDGRHPASVRFLSSLEEDLSRRDFTVNAMALSADGVLTDPFRGVSDLKRKIIRCVGEAEIRFREDALRMLRAVRFSAQLGFSIEEKTAAAIAACASLAARLSAERVRDEIEKTLCSPRPELSSEFLSRGLLISRLDDSSFSPGDFSRLRSLPNDPLLRWAGFGSLLVREGALSDLPAFFTRLRLDGKTIRACFAAVSILRGGLPANAAGWRLALSRHGIPACRFAAAMAAARGDDSVFETLSSVLESGACFSQSGLAVRGGDLLPLGFSGPAVGEAMNRLLLHVIRHPEDNEREKLLALVRGYRAGDSETGTSRD